MLFRLKFLLLNLNSQLLFLIWVLIDIGCMDFVDDLCSRTCYFNVTLHSSKSIWLPSLERRPLMCYCLLITFGGCVVVVHVWDGF